MILKDAPVLQRFRTLGRRRILIKFLPYGQNSHILTDQLGNVQHHPNGDPIHIPHCTVRNSSGQKFDMKADTEIIPVA